MNLGEKSDYTAIFHTHERQRLYFPILGISVTQHKCLVHGCSAVHSPHHVRLLCDPMDCTSPGSCVRGISQARTLGWVAIFFSTGSSQPSDQTCISALAGGFPSGTLDISNTLFLILLNRAQNFFD